MIEELTILALVVLGLEYFTRLFSRGLAAIGRALRSLATPRPAGLASGMAIEAPERAAKAVTPAPVAPVVPKIKRVVSQASTETRSDASPVELPPTLSTVLRPVADHSERTSAKARLVEPVPRANGAGAATTSAIAVATAPRLDAAGMAAAEIVTMIESLESIAHELARDACLGTGRALIEPLKELAVDYDLDNLMAMANDTLNRDIIAFYREVLAVAFALERHVRSASRIGMLELGHQTFEASRVELRARLAVAIARGGHLVQSLQPHVQIPGGAADNPE